MARAESKVDIHCPKDCAYRMNLSSSGDIHMCGYILLTKKMRGTPVEQCDKYVKGKRKRKREFNTLEYIVEPDEESEE